LTKRIERLESLMLHQSNVSGKQFAAISPALLEQNTPNPFNHITSIRYTLPKHFSSAYILVNDNNGKTIKQFNISGTGNGIVHVDASTLPSGAYHYSLIIDGKIIETKKMISTK